MGSNSIMEFVACNLLIVILVASIMATSAADDGNILRLGIQRNEFNIMNPFTAPWDNGGIFGMTHVPLAVFGPDLNLAPCLADTWDISSDGRSITFHLVNNASWSDGKPVTADDVAFSFEYWAKLSETDARSLWLDSYLDSAKVINEETVEVIFKDPLAVATIVNQIPITFIVPKHIWEEVNDPTEYDGNDAMIGCGPFIFEKYDQDAQAAYLKANSDYFAGKPTVDKIEWRYFRTLDSLLMALEKGEIDAQMEYYQPVSGVYAADLIKTNGVELCIVPDVGVPVILIFGFKQYPSNVTEFRQAISYAIDYEEVVDMIVAGYGEVPGKGFNSPALPGYDADLPELEYDPEKANELLDTSGFVDKDGDGLREMPDGNKLQIPLTPNPKPKFIRTAEVISRQLRDVGLDVYVQSLSSDVFRRVLLTDKDFTMIITQSSPFTNLGADSAASVFVDLPGMYGTCTDPEIIGLVDNAIHSKDVDELTKNRKSIQAYMAREQPMIALIWEDAIYPVRTDRWEGWTPMYGYGPATYWSWFSLEPISE